MNPLRFALIAAGLFIVPGCNGLGYPGVFNGNAGSCTYPASDGFIACEDFLGSDFNSEVGQSLCANETVGTWSQNPCPTAGALGTCAVTPIGTGSAQNVQYTYSASPDPDAGPATALTAETACGEAGGTFASATAHE